MRAAEVVAILANINRDPKYGPITALQIVPHLRLAISGDDSDVEDEFQRTPEELARDYAALTRALANP